MSKLRLMLVGKLLSILAMSLFILPIHIVTAFAEEKATTKIQHKHLEYYVSGNRIQVDAKVEDKTGVTLVRCFFRVSGQADYAFVPMQEKDKGVYSGILPAPADQTGSMEYLFLVVNNQNRVVKSQIITVNKREQKGIPSWQILGKEGSIPVSSEIYIDTTGYYADNLGLNLIDPSLRFGYAVALYDVSKMVAAGNTTGMASTVSGGGVVIADSSGGKVIATAGGLSTGSYIGFGVAGVAIIGLAAAAGGGGGGGGNDPIPILTVNSFNKQVNAASESRQGTGVTINIGDSLKINATGTWNDWPTGGHEYVGPEGYGYYNSRNVEPNYYSGALLTYIGSNLVHGAVASFEYTSTKEGELSFRMNDFAGCYDDNSGIITVSGSVTRN